MKRVVITGVGLHTPLGNDLDTVMSAVLANETGVRPAPEWADFADLGTHVFAPVADFDGKHIPRKMRRTMGRVAQLAASAAERALEGAGLTAEDVQDGRTGVVVGSTAGSGGAEHTFWSHLERAQSARGIKSTLFFQAMSHTCAANIALLLGVTGEVIATNAACASSNQAIGIGTDRIRLGRAERVIVGGAEELHLSGGVIFHALQAATTGFNGDPDRTPRPFDRGRDGIVVGEGAGILILEEREAALARGAPILGEVLGHASTCDARHMANPEPAGMEACIRWALADAGVPPEAIDYVNAHATGTRLGDASEAEALLRTVGDAVPTSSTKGHLGHLLGACGAVEAALCLAAMDRGVLPGTRNLEDPDVAPVRLLAAPEEAAARTVLNTNFAFGGVNAAVVLGDAARARQAR